MRSVDWAGTATKRFGRRGLTWTSRAALRGRSKVQQLEWWAQYAARFCDMPVGCQTYGFEALCYPGAERPASIGACTSIATGLLMTGVNHPTQHATMSPVTYLRSRGFVSADTHPDVRAVRQSSATTAGLGRA